MSDILDILAASAKERTERHKKIIPAEKMRKLAEEMPKSGFEFEKALKKEGMSFICECKKASTSKGLIAPDFR